MKRSDRTQLPLSNAGRIELVDMIGPRSRK